MYMMYFLWIYFFFWWPASRIYIPCIFCGYIFYSGGQPPEYIYHVFFVAIFFILVASLQDMYMMYFCGYILYSGGQPPGYVYDVFLWLYFLFWRLASRICI